MSGRTVRVAVVSPDGALAHPGLSASALDVVAELPDIAELLKAPSHEHEAAVVGCSASQLGDAHFQSQLTRLARTVPTVLVVPHVTRRAAAVAARAHAFGLVSRDSPPEQLVRAVRSVVRGHIAYPPEALAVLLRLLPPASPRRASLDPTT